MLINKEYARSAVFGIEDALVSTTGMIIGISTGTSNKEFIILATLVTISVEAVSMAAGQYLTERTVHEIERGRHSDNSIVGAIIMLFSYLLGGIIPSFPIFFTTFPVASIWVLAMSFIGLYVLGFIKGKMVNVSPTRSAMEMLIVGGIATGIGAIAGYFLKT